MSKKPKVMIIGLDGGTFDLIKPLVDAGKLPNIARLLRSGASGNLQTTLPPMTFPAWNAFMTGKNPGKHGVYDFMERKQGTYELDVINALHRKSDTIWKIASSHGVRCGVVGVPVTYPPEEINGVMISGFDAPFVDERIAYPRELFGELRKNVGEYIVSAVVAKHLRAGDVDKALEAILSVVERKAETAKYILKTRDPDLFMIVFGETDVAIHWLWKYHDKNSPLRDQRSHKELAVNPISAIYEKIDEHIGELLNIVSDETIVMIMSDHGAGGNGDQVVFVNRFLESQGLLRFKHLPALRYFNKNLDRLKSFLNAFLPKKLHKKIRYNPKGKGLKWESKLRFSFIDWQQTKVYAEETSYFPNIRINLKGRDPEGLVPQHEYREIIAETIKLLHAWKNPLTGENVIRKAYWRGDLYHGDFLEKAPEIIISWNLSRGYSYLFKPSFLSSKGQTIERLSSKEIEKSVFLLNRSGSHRQEGVFVISGYPVRHGAVIEDPRIIDLAPTILYLLDIPIPVDMDGRVLFECFKPEHIKEASFDAGAQSGDEKAYQYTDEETDSIRKQLEGLGYL